MIERQNRRSSRAHADQKQLWLADNESIPWEMLEAHRSSYAPHTPECIDSVSEINLTDTQAVVGPKSSLRSVFSICTHTRQIGTRLIHHADAFLHSADHQHPPIVHRDSDQNASLPSEILRQSLREQLFSFRMSWPEAMYTFVLLRSESSVFFCVSHCTAGLSNYYINDLSFDCL